jgi:hypothetical protein
MCDWAGKDWRQHLNMAEFAINGSASSVTGMTPFFSKSCARAADASERRASSAERAGSG